MAAARKKKVESVETKQPVAVPLAPTSLAVHRVPLESITGHDEKSGWKYEHHNVHRKLIMSLTKWGQLRPLVVRDQDGKLVLVDGRQLYRAMREMGWTEVLVINLGAVSEVDAVLAALSLEIRAEIDYAKLAFAIAAAIGQGLDRKDAASASPFSVARIDQFCELATFDWSQYAPPVTAQHAIDWGVDEAPTQQVDTQAQEVATERASATVDTGCTPGEDGGLF